MPARVCLESLLARIREHIHARDNDKNQQYIIIFGLCASHIQRMGLPCGQGRADADRGSYPPIPLPPETESLSLSTFLSYFLSLFFFYSLLFSLTLSFYIYVLSIYLSLIYI